MKKFFQILAVAVVLAVAGYAIFRAMASDETRIRWLIEDTIEAFNNSRAGGTVEGLDEGYREETAKLTRDEVKLIVLRLFFQERDAQTKDFRFRVEPGKLEVKLDPAAPLKASFTLVVEFRELRGGTYEPGWTAEIDASLEKKEGEWKIVTSRHKTLSGKRPF